MDPCDDNAALASSDDAADDLQVHAVLLAMSTWHAGFTATKYTK
jgi:hypothetical protein